MGRALIWAGLFLVVMGILVSLGGSFWNRIPGNFTIRGKNWTVYFPLGISILLSIIATLLMWLFNKMR